MVVHQLAIICERLRTAAIWRCCRAGAAGHARLPELRLRQAQSALHCIMVDNVSGVHFAHQRHRANDLVCALASTCLRPVTKMICISFEQRSSGCSSCMRARDRAGTGRGGFGGSGLESMTNGVQAGARRTRPADFLIAKARLPAYGGR